MLPLRRSLDAVEKEPVGAERLFGDGCETRRVERLCVAQGRAGRACVLLVPLGVQGEVLGAVRVRTEAIVLDEAAELRLGDRRLRRLDGVEDRERLQAT